MSITQREVEELFDKHSTSYHYYGRALDWDDFTAAIHELLTHLGLPLPTEEATATTRPRPKTVRQASRE